MRRLFQTQRGMVALWLTAFIPLLFVSDAADAIWIGVTFIALLLVPDARKATFPMVYRSVPISLLIGAAVGIIVFASDFILVPPLELLTNSRLDSSLLDGLHGNPGLYAEWMLKGMLIGGVFEEVFFRGFFIGWGVCLFGRRSAVPLAVLVAIVFGMGHSDQALVGMIMTGLAGLLFGLTYVACGRKLLPAITAHALSNALTVTHVYFYGLT